MILWLDTYPTNGVKPQTDNISVINWTNFVDNSLATISGGIGPTNFTSGGGPLNRDRVYFKNNTNHRLIVTPAGGAPSALTVVCVVNCDSTTLCDNLLHGNSALEDVLALRFKATKLEIQSDNGSVLTGPTTITTAFYQITAIFNGASSQIRTNGAVYVSGSIGTIGGANDNAWFLGQLASCEAYNGSMCRIWAWGRALTATEINNAEALCVSDFGL